MKAGDHVRYFRSVPARGNDTAQEAVYGTVIQVEAKGTMLVRVAGLGATLLSQKKCELVKRGNVSPAPASQGILFQGTDTMAVKVITVKKASKNSPKATKAAKAQERPVVGKRSVGRTFGLGTMATWIKLFQENAKKKMTDDQISKFMHKEFPDSTATDFDNIQRVRTFYNSGKRFPAPKVSYKRYDTDGSVIEGRVMKPRAEKAAKSVKAGKSAKSVGVKASPKSPVVEKARFQLKKKA